MPLLGFRLLVSLQLTGVNPSKAGVLPVVVHQPLHAHGRVAAQLDGTHGGRLPKRPVGQIESSGITRHRLETVAPSSNNGALEGDAKFSSQLREVRRKPRVVSIPLRRLLEAREP